MARRVPQEMYKGLMTNINWQSNGICFIYTVFQYKIYIIYMLTAQIILNLLYFVFKIYPQKVYVTGLNYIHFFQIEIWGLRSEAIISFWACNRRFWKNVFHLSSSTYSHFIHHENLICMLCYVCFKQNNTKNKPSFFVFIFVF